PVNLINGTLTDPAAGVPGAQSPQGLNLIGPPGAEFRPNMIQTWSLTLQRELIHNGVLSAAYVGSGGRHLEAGQDINFPLPSKPSISDPNCLQPGQDPNATYQFDPCLRSEEHTSELQSRFDLVCRLLLEKKKKCVSYS